jgi:GTP-binding protein
VKSASFILSAASEADFPQTGVPEIALVGRSNVGKSSLINALVKQTIARTSAAPGKTRLANYYLVEGRSPKSEAHQTFYLVDLPGYGYARGGKDSAEAFEALTDQYFRAPGGSRRLIAGVLHLVDARHPDLPQDVSAHRWVAKTGFPLAVVATKMDKLKQADRPKVLRALGGLYEADVLPESALKHEGLDDIWKAIRAWLGRSRRDAADI